MVTGLLAHLESIFMNTQAFSVWELNLEMKPPLDLGYQ